MTVAPTRPDSSPAWIVDRADAAPFALGRLAIVLLLAVVLPFAWVVGTQLAGPDDGTLLAPHMSTDPAKQWSDGLHVPNVHDETPLRAGDLVTAIGGRDVVSLAAYEGPAHGVGEVVRYTVLRGGERLEFDVALERYDVVAGFMRHLEVFAVPLFVLAIAAFVFARRPRERPAQLMLAVSAFLLAGTAAWPLGLRAIDFGGGRGAWPYWSSDVANALMWGAFLHFALVFPKPPRAVLRRPWLPVGCYLLPFALFALSLAFTLPSAETPLARLEQSVVVSHPVALVASPLLLVMFALSYRRTTDPADRGRLRLVVASLVIAVSLYLVIGQVPNALTGDPLVSWDVLQGVFLICPLAIAAAILRSQLFDVQVLVRRSLVFGLLTGGLLLISAGVLAGLTRLSGDSTVAALAAGAAVALCFHPLRTRLRVWVGGLVFGARHDPYQVVSELGRLDLGADPLAGLQRTVETLAATLRLSYVAVELPGRTVSTGRHRGGAPITIPLGWGERSSGRLLLEVMPGREPFGRADRRLLEDVASQVSRLTDLVLLNAALRESRTRIISAREEERRRLHRDLHDGIGPTLAAQAMQIDVARVLLDSDRDEADEVLGRIADETKGAIGELRRVVDDLRPHALDELGLAAGIRKRCRGFTLRVDVIAAALPELPAAVEVAAYRIAIEAVNNAARHGQAKTCRVELAVECDELHLRVRDDGIGLPGRRRAGVGLGSMRERAEELGGRFTAERDPAGGTIIRAAIPLAPLREVTQ